jgi:ribosomal protein L7/L12
VFWKIVLKGDNPSGRFLAVLYARSGETIESVRRQLSSPEGMVLQSGLSRERVDTLAQELPGDGSVQISIQPDEVVFVPILMGYRPGSRGRLRIALQKLSKLSTEEVIRFLSRIPIALKLDSDLSTAESIKKVLEKAGGIVEIRSPQNLFGVSSRKKPSTHQQREIASVKQVVKRPVVTSAEREFPFVVSDSGCPPASVQVDILPEVFDYQPPVPAQVSVPPAVVKKVGEEGICLPPHVVRFTVPAAAVPSVVSGEPVVVPPPVQSKKVVLVYLFPVVPHAVSRVQSVLSETLGFSLERAQQFISKAPVAVAGFSRRSDALKAIAELADNGTPVSLVPGSSVYAEVSAGRSLVGWLSGHGSVS